MSSPLRSARLRALFAIACLSLVGAIFAGSAQALPAGNLLANPAGETAPTIGAEEIRSVPGGWTQVAVPGSGEVHSQGAYDSCYGGSEAPGVLPERDVLEKEYGEKIHGGARFFFAGDWEKSELTQEINVNAAEVLGARLLIGGDFGGFADQEDFATLSAHFLNSGGTQISAFETARVLQTERGGVTGFVHRETSATVPAGTAKIRFLLLQKREEGSDNDGYADNLFATFDASAPAMPTPTGDASCPYTAPVVTPIGPPAPPVLPAPAVQITKHPAKETAETKAPFSFTGTAGGSFECSLDGGAFKPCTSGTDFGPVQPGDHRFEVREVLGGKTSAPASYEWTVDLPKECVLRVARARVFAYTKRSAARLVIHYTSYKPARVDVSYKLTGAKGALDLGSATAQFSKAGVFRLPETLSSTEEAKLKAAKSFSVKFKIPGTPSNCARYYTKKLTIPQKVSGQTVWFQSDSRFGPGGPS
jgi:hypothetical protein